MPLPTSTLNKNTTLTPAKSQKDLYEELAVLVQKAKDSMAEAEAFADKHNLRFTVGRGDYSGTYYGDQHGGYFEPDSYGWQGSNC